MVGWHSTRPINILKLFELPIKDAVDQIDPSSCKKPVHFRSIQVSVSTFLEAFAESKMDFRIPHYVLYDFEDQEECKVIRMIFAHANIPYEFKSVDRDDYILEDFPFYALPMLEVNDKKLGNVPSICRQLGWRYDLSGQTAKEDSQVDMIAEKVYQARLRLKSWLDHIEYRADHECDAPCSTASALHFLDSYILPIMEKIIKENESAWVVGSKMSWADLMVCCLFNPIIYHRPEVFDRYPNVYLHNKRISELDQFKGFLYHVRERSFE